MLKSILLWEKSRKFAMRHPLILKTETTAIPSGCQDAGRGGVRRRPGLAHGAPGLGVQWLTE